MSGVALVLLALLACLILVFALIVCLPVTLWLHVEMTAGAWSFRSALQPLGRFGPRIALSTRSRQKTTSEAPAAKADRLGRMKMGKFVPAMLRFLRDFLARIRLHRLRIDLDYGLGDPALTGELFGVVAPILYGTHASQRIEARITPHFDRKVLRGSGDLALSLTPVTLAGPALRFGWTMMRGSQ